MPNHFGTDAVWRSWTNVTRCWGRVAGILVLVATLLLGSFGAPVGAVVFDVPNVESAILVVADTGQVLFEKNADTPLPPASLVKMMTMLLTVEAVEQGLINWSDVVTVSPRAAAIDGSQIWVAAGDTLTVSQLLAAVAIHSANDASIALAEHISGTEQAFVDWMNRRAQQLGMVNTRFINAHGWDRDYEGESRMSARDAMIVARELILKYPDILDFTREPEMWLGPTGTRNPIRLENTNQLVRDASRNVDGLKTGFTNEAGYLLVATEERDGMRLISVVMRAETSEIRYAETRRLLNFGFTHEYVQVGEAGKTFPVEIAQAVGTAEVYLAEPLMVLAPRSSVVDIQVEVLLKDGIRAPLKADTEVGEVVVTVDGREVGRAPAYLTADVRRQGFFARAWNATLNFFTNLFQ